MEYPIHLEQLPPFPLWLEREVQRGQERFADDGVDLSMKPNVKAHSFKSMKAYGMHLCVSSVEANLVTADSGVTVTCETVQQSGRHDRSPVSGMVTYYGKIVEILELNYDWVKPIVLLCDWVEPIRRGPTTCMKEDKYGYTSVKLNRVMRRSSNSFVFPLQVPQIFFSESHHKEVWSVVLYVESRSIRNSQQLLGNTSLSSFDMEGNSLPQSLSDKEDLDVDVGSIIFEGDGDIITENDLLRARVSVENQA